MIPYFCCQLTYAVQKSSLLADKIVCYCICESYLRNFKVSDATTEGMLILICAWLFVLEIRGGLSAIVYRGDHFCDSLFFFLHSKDISENNQEMPQPLVFPKRHAKTRLRECGQRRPKSVCAFVQYYQGIHCR